MRRVLIGTPCYDGKTDVWYNDSLNNSIRLALKMDIDLQVVYMAYDSLVQRARNDIVKLAIENDFDDLVFIDSDQGWKPESLFRMLDHPVDVVGAPVPKKTDAQEIYNVRINNIAQFGTPYTWDYPTNGLIPVDGIGTGMLRLSKKALQDLWNISEVYRNEGRESRMVFDIKIVNGDLVSEDNIVCNKLKDLGYPIYVDRTMTCSHIGVKKWEGNFEKYLIKKIQESDRQYLEQAAA